MGPQHTLAHVFDVKSQEVKKILKEKAKHDQEESSREKELKKIQKSYEQEMKAWEDDFNKKKWEIWQNTGVFNQPAAVKEDDSSSESDSDTSIGTQQQNIDEYTWEVAEAEGLTKSQYRRVRATLACRSSCDLLMLIALVTGISGTENTIGKGYCEGRSK